MDLNQILSAILAGGLAGQLTSLFLGYRYEAKREYINWLRKERYQVFSNLLASISAAASREDIETWPDEIRVLSQKVHLLYDTGDAPKDVADSLQTVFTLALDRKLGRVEDLREWRNKMREEARKLRQNLAKILHS